MIASMPQLDYYTDLDLGQARDCTALAVPAAPVPRRRSAQVHTVLSSSN
jgi:hypothetical protein